MHHAESSPVYEVVEKMIDLVGHGIHGLASTIRSGAYALMSLIVKMEMKKVEVEEHPPEREHVSEQRQHVHDKMESILSMATWQMFYKKLCVLAVVAGGGAAVSGHWKESAGATPVAAGVLAYLSYSRRKRADELLEESTPDFTRSKKSAVMTAEEFRRIMKEPTPISLPARIMPSIGESAMTWLRVEFKKSPELRQGFRIVHGRRAQKAVAESKRYDRERAQRKKSRNRNPIEHEERTLPDAPEIEKDPYVFTIDTGTDSDDMSDGRSILDTFNAAMLEEEV